MLIRRFVCAMMPRAGTHACGMHAFTATGDASNSNERAEPLPPRLRSLASPRFCAPNRPQASFNFIANYPSAFLRSRAERNLDLDVNVGEK